MKYKIVEAATVQQLEWHVHLWIGKGWIPLGGLVVGPGAMPLKQTMVKRDEARDDTRVEPARSRPDGRRKPKLLEGEIVD